MEYARIVFICANQLLLSQVFSGCMEVFWPMVIALHILEGNRFVVGWLVGFVCLLENISKPLLSKI